MSVNILRDKEILVAEHRTTLEFHIQYALLEDDKKGFRILVYHERQNFRFDERSPNSDMPFALWLPDGRGLRPLCRDPFYSLQCARLTDEMNRFCEAAHTAWEEGKNAE